MHEYITLLYDFGNSGAFLQSAGSGLIVTVACVKLLLRKAGSRDVNVTRNSSLPSRILSLVIVTVWHCSSPETDPSSNVSGKN